MKRFDGLTDYEDLTSAQQAQARSWIATFATLTSDDAPLFAFRITIGSQGVPAGIVSTSRKDGRPASGIEDRWAA